VSPLDWSLKAHLALIDVVNVSKICLEFISNAKLHCPGIIRNADDWAAVSVSALYSANDDAYAGKVCVRM